MEKLELFRYPGYWLGGPTTEIWPSVEISIKPQKKNNKKKTFTGRERSSAWAGTQVEQPTFGKLAW